MRSQPSVMNHSFSQIPRAEIPRSTFDRSHGHKTTFDAGFLIPFLVDEALPGDTFNVNTTAFARLATPIFPIMDNMFMDTQFFAVPVRLVWDNWQKFNGEQTDPGDSTDFLVPQIQAPSEGYTSGSIYDYMGIPPAVPNLLHSALWLRAYNLVWNQWYRDQNLQDSLLVYRDDGPDPYGSYTLQRRGKRHDYFTSALPFPQKGPGVSIPLAGQARVSGIGKATSTFQPPSGTPRLETGLPGDFPTGTQVVYPFETFITGADVANNDTRYVIRGTQEAGGYPMIYAELGGASAITINSLRQAFQIQKIFERDARGGTRYTEVVWSHFRVKSPDARLQRPEYLGGGSTPVNVSPIPQTSSTDATSPQGSLAAMGTVSLHNHGFTQSFTEHCLILGLVSVRADLTYQQGINRMWHRRTRFDFFWPALAQVGEQAVLQKEIFATGVPVADDKTFGFQERYAEYRYKPSLITGLFRSSVAQPLDSWHLSQEFATAPVLDSEFIVENPPVDRIIAVPDEPHFLFDSYIRMHCTRPMPVYGVPGMMDHF